MDLDAMKAALDSVDAAAQDRYGDLHVANVDRLSKFIATCKMVLDDCEHTVPTS